MADNCRRNDDGAPRSKKPRYSSNTSNIASRNQCMQHGDMVVVYYCGDHQIDCCMTCMEDHKQCVLLNLEDIQHEFSSFSERIQYAVENAQHKYNGINLYSKRIETHIQYGETKIRSCFDRIRVIVDKAEKETLKKLEKLREEENSFITSYLNENSLLKKQLEQIREEGSRISTTESSETVLLPSVCNVMSKEAVEFSKRHEDNLTFIERRLNDAHESTKEINSDFIMKDATLLDQIIKDLTDIVKISPLRVSTKDPLVKYKEISCEGTIWDVKILPGGKDELLLVTVGDNSLKRMNTSGNVSRSVNLPDSPTCLCVYLDRNRYFVAITFPDKSLIRFYKMADFTDVGQIQLSGGCSGISRLDNNFVVTFLNDGVVRKIDDSGDVIDSSGKHFTEPVYLTVSDYRKYILVSDEGNNSVVAMKTDLKQILFRMSHKDLVRPLGICIGNENRIYVCSLEGRCVVEFTIDGKYVFTHITPGEGLPQCLCYDKIKSTLIVSKYITDYKDKIQLYRHQV